MELQLNDVVICTLFGKPQLYEVKEIKTKAKEYVLRPYKDNTPSISVSINGSNAWGDYLFLLNDSYSDSDIKNAAERRIQSEVDKWQKEFLSQKSRDDILNELFLLWFQTDMLITDSKPPVRDFHFEARMKVALRKRELFAGKLEAWFGFTPKA